MNEEDIKSCHDALMRAIEKENKKMDRRNRWRRRFKLLMVFGVIMFSISAVTAAFTKSLVAGFMVLGIVCILSYPLYRLYNECNDGVGNYRGW